MGNLWKKGSRFKGSEVVNYDGRLLFRLLGSKLTMRTIVEKKGGVKEKLSSSKMIEKLGTLVYASTAFPCQDFLHDRFIH